MVGSEHGEGVEAEEPEVRVIISGEEFLLELVKGEAEGNGVVGEAGNDGADALE